jgi:UDP-N-acetylglucosamine 2-epimerase (non-hydrolysing)/GDP/UDP-N,N'-diacetylbacillosamine 2-epimerase (hydrolysing)
MSSLYRTLANDPNYDFKLVVGGAHLSKTYGMSIVHIHEDKLPILIAVESLVDGDSKADRLKSASNYLAGIIDVVAEWSPDIIMYAGDREEVWIGAMLGIYLGIPTMHFYGGDHTLSGYVDNPVRHATSKLSTMNVVATEEHRKRLLSIGEPSDRIFVSGNLSLDNFVSTRVIPLEKLRETIGLPEDFSEFALLIFHPIISEELNAKDYLETILTSCLKEGLKVCVGYPNTDPANRGLIEVIDNYKNDKRVFSYKNLSRADFISLYRHSQFIIGNSSSGILEAASIPLGAIDIGSRQVGRLAGENVVRCGFESSQICGAIKKVRSSDFQSKIKRVTNPYGNGQSTQKVINFLNRISLKEMVLKKEDPLG